MTTAHEYAKANGSRFEEQLIDLLKIKSISTLPECDADVQQAAEWVAADMRRIGLTTVEILPTGGHPVVYGEWSGAGSNAPTVLVYGHYDVQPAVKSDGWNNEPFEPVIDGGKIWARGSAMIKDRCWHSLRRLRHYWRTVASRTST